ncbi:LysR substrate-binding domain-containing protein [Streptomyces sp. NPDC048442]|uniref:LysR substrate-binding domain-containing protein n=1 Tax=Streptomyces sp. NPDC048442 TaxID=3154823 RepID=UPI00341C7B06
MWARLSVPTLSPLISAVSARFSPLGVVLHDRSATACDLLDRVFSSQAEFDPATETREFTLLGSDYGAAVFGAALSRLVHDEAPNVRLTFRQSTPAVVENTAAELTSVDGLLMPHAIIDGFPSVDLLTDRWVCLVADDHPEIGTELTLDDLARLPWAVYQRPYDAPAARQLSMIGVSPRVEVSVQTFQLLPYLVEGTRRVAMIQERLARRVAGPAAVRILPCPFEAVPVREAMWWHPVHTHDPAHIWLRETAARAARRVRG